MLSLEAKSNTLRRQARRVLGQLHPQDVKPLFALFGSYREAQKVAHRHRDSWERLVSLGLASADRADAHLCAMTELGRAAVDLLRVQVGLVGKTFIWRKTGKPVFVNNCRA